MSKSITPREILALLEQQNYRCAYTGGEMTPETVSADHEVPLANGGTHTLDNIRLVLAVVNRAKGTMTLEDFVEMCRKVVEHHDRMAQPLCALESEQ